MDPVREGPPDPQQGPGPFDVLVDAVCRYDGPAAAAVLAPDAVLTVPPLRITLADGEVVARALVDVAFAFDDLTYTLRGRYLTPGGVTDEAVLVGTHNRDLLGAPPTGNLGQVPMRLIVSHDGQRVTRLDVWPDIAAVRGLCDETARHIDERIQGAAGGLVTALRATMPVAAAKVVVGTVRETPARAATPVTTQPEALAPAVAVGNQRSAGRTEGTKLPTPRRTQRLRAVAAGTVMLVAVAGIVWWIAQGALSTNASSSLLTYPSPLPTSAGPSVPPSSEPAASPSPTPASPSPSASDAPLTVDANNQVEISSDLLFETDSATIAPEFLDKLQGLIDLIQREHRVGKITVRGYTDNRGTAAHNLDLSQRRAQAVVSVLRKGLPASSWTVVGKGYGAKDPKADNGTAEGQRMNRRVTVTVPAAQPTPSAGGSASLATTDATTGPTSAAPASTAPAPRTTAPAPTVRTTTRTTSAASTTSPVRPPSTSAPAPPPGTEPPSSAAG